MRAQTAELLQEYRRKRDFGKTPEPSGEVAAAGGRLYVMHWHWASHEHFDLRLEHEGVLKSWALPKGPSLEPGEKRLAVEVEDHPLDYGSFEGVIPKDAYGGGTVMLWDAGTWSVNGKLDANHVDFVLAGEKLEGAWTLVRTGMGDRRKRAQEQRAKRGKSWLLIKRSDEPARKLEPVDTSVISGRTMDEIKADRDLVWHGRNETDLRDPPAPGALDGARKATLPKAFEPQLATLVDEAPESGEWIHEIKLDGYRMLARVERGRARLSTRNGHDWSDRFPVIAAALNKLPVKTALLDGEVVVLGADGATSFTALQEALGDGRAGGAGRTGRGGSFVYFCFDLLHLDGYDLARVPQLARKQATRQLLQSGGYDKASVVRFSDHVAGQGPEFHAQACQLGLEGIISKRADAGYRRGRGRAWLKVKCTHHQDFVVGGFTRPAGSRIGFGALLVGGHDEAGELVYAGRVGTGFTTRQLGRLHEALRAMEVDHAPFRRSANDDLGDVRQVHWTKPHVVIEVEFTERTRDGRLRHPTFRGVREDREAAEILLDPNADLDDTHASPNPPIAPITPITSERPVNASRRPAVKRRPAGKRARGDAEVAGVRVSSPDRVMYPEAGVTKLDIARYYEAIGDWVLPHLANRPLSLVRCPEGRQGECFYQKHLGKAQAKSVPRVGFRESRGVKEYAYVRTVADIVALVQNGVLELHPFGCQVGDLERPDVMVFDLDPDPAVPWSQVVSACRGLQERIEGLGLAGFLRTTGGKGLHVVVPLKAKADWDTVKGFARKVSEAHAQDDPEHFTTNMSKARRRGRIFIDYLRNSRGATAIASYSLRAREGAPIATPVRWDELGPALRGDKYHFGNIRRRLSALKEDPWQEFMQCRHALTAARCRKVGLN